MTAVKDVGNRALNYGLAQVGFWIILGHSVPHSDFDDRGVVAMLQNVATDRVVGGGQLKVKIKVLTTGSTENTGETGERLTPLFVRTYAWSSSAEGF
jgi:hypothetical protein